MFFKNLISKYSLTSFRSVGQQSQSSSSSILANHHHPRDNHVMTNILSPYCSTHITRTFFASRTLRMGLDEFRDSESRETRRKENVGRSWTVHELRRKSFDDLHKLWYVLYKEKNMLLTEKKLSRRHGILLPQQERQTKVKHSMKAIKVVLGERKRDAIAQHALRMAEKELQERDGSNDDKIQEPTK